MVKKAIIEHNEGLWSLENAVVFNVLSDVVLREHVSENARGGLSLAHRLFRQQKKIIEKCSKVYARSVDTKYKT